MEKKVVSNIETKEEIGTIYLKDTRIIIMGAKLKSMLSSMEVKEWYPSYEDEVSANLFNILDKNKHPKKWFKWVDDALLEIGYVVK